MAEWVEIETVQSQRATKVAPASTKPLFDGGDDNTKYIGGVAEWLKAPHSKRGKGESPSEVQILSPPHFFEKGSRSKNIFVLEFISITIILIYSRVISSVG